MVDFFSRFLEIVKLCSTSSQIVVSQLKVIMSRMGGCDTLVTDGGPQYSSQQFRDFVKLYGIRHIVSSPRYPRGNSTSERAVQTVKQMLKKGVDPHVALLEYHATPLANGCSPAELLMGRKIKKICCLKNPSNLKPRLPNFQFIKRKESVMRKKAKLNHDTKRRAPDLPPLKEEMMYF